MKLLKSVSIILILVAVTSCVQDAHLKTITVKIDMTTIENPAKVGIRGTHPLSWDETTYLNDPDGDGIYEDTFQIYATGNTVEFKFVNNGTEFELQDKSNRILSFEFKPETIIYEAIFNNTTAIKITRK
jgi:hypothetical protein